MRERHEVERLIGTRLPRGGRLRSFRWQPDRDLAFFTVYVRLELPRDEFTELMRRMGMDWQGGGAADRYLPAAWAAAAPGPPDWWDPDQATPADAAAKPFGANGWIVAKYERGSAYLIVTDTGPAEGTPGPW